MGCLNMSKNYSVFSIAVDNNATGIDYQFYAPLTALAWKRVGFGSVLVVSIVKENGTLLNHALLSHILSSVLKQGAFILLMVAKPTEVVPVAQVARLAAPSIISQLEPKTANLYMVTSDTDLWPINVYLFLLPYNMKIQSRRPIGNKSISSHNMSYPHFAMTFIGMCVQTWNQLLTPNHLTSLPTNSSTLTNYVTQVLKSEIKANNRKAGPGWFTDQKLLSYLLRIWMDTYGTEQVHINWTRSGRIDRIGWNPKSLEEKIDAHLLTDPYDKKVWNRQLMPLIVLMYGESVKDMLFCLHYFSKFRELLKKRNKIRV